MTFLSCGHNQTTNDEELFSGGEGGEVSAESGENDSQDLSNVADASDADATLEPTDTEKEAAEAAAAEPETTEEKSDETLTAADTTETPASPDLLTTSESEGPAPEQTQAFEAPADVAPVADNSESLAPETAATPTAEIAETAPVAEATPETTFEAPVAEETTATLASETPAPKKAKAERNVASAAPASVVAKTPKIPTGVVTRKGQTLNRFYFLRSGDTPISTSQLIYGNGDRGNDLLAWNGDDWKPGKLVYFTSPENPSDTEMKSFYMERGVATEEYTVQNGDWLSKIANTAYGNSNSWKEIAVLNGMDTPDAIEPGTKISLYPAKMPERSAKTETVAKAVPPEAVPAVAAVAATPPAPPAAATPENAVPPQDSHAVAATTPAEPLADDDELLPPPPAPVANADQPAPAVDKSLQKKGAAELASPEVGSFFEKHILAVIAAMAVICAAVFGVRRYKKSREFLE